MKLDVAALALPLLASTCLAAAVDLWSSPLKQRDIPIHEPIDPKTLKSIIDGPQKKVNLDAGEIPHVYFCQGEKWQPPCYVFSPDLEYTCEELGPDLAGQIGSVFVEQGIICRLATLSVGRCYPIHFFAWPEIQGGWDNLTSWAAPESVQTAGHTTLGSLTTHFTCARCDNCPPPL
ncbi:hypothetical protein BGZ63DRAFT_380619 [Mariannaea sp. PMI_226]|nr:hypothetical protein BGZ63DRAFT_380619 [Mariannaea sp. PMI_226]